MGLPLFKLSDHKWPAHGILTRIAYAQRHPVNGCADMSSETKHSKTCLKRSIKKNTKLVFNTDYRLMQVKSIAECSKGSILQYFRPSFSYHFPFRTFLSIFSGRLRQVLLYLKFGLSNHLHPYFVYASSEGSSESAQLRMLATAFVTRQSTGYQNSMCCPN